MDHGLEFLYREPREVQDQRHQGWHLLPSCVPHLPPRNLVQQRPHRPLPPPAAPPVNLLALGPVADCSQLSWASPAWGLPWPLLSRDPALPEAGVGQGLGSGLRRRQSELRPGGSNPWHVQVRPLGSLALVDGTRPQPGPSAWTTCADSHGQAAVALLRRCHLWGCRNWVPGLGLRQEAGSLRQGASCALKEVLLAGVGRPGGSVPCAWGGGAGSSLPPQAGVRPMTLRS